MLPLITTTHAVPQHLPSGRLGVTDGMAICHYCFEVLGVGASPDLRAKLEAKHSCKDKLQAQQPAICVPFN